MRVSVERSYIDSQLQQNTHETSARIISTLNYNDQSTETRMKRVLARNKRASLRNMRIKILAKK